MADSASPDGPLTGTRILSLALNLPGPAAVMRCRAMGADCTKLEPPSAGGADPMGRYAPRAYDEMHHGIRKIVADLKTEAGQAVLHGELAGCDVLVTSFRPSALGKLKLEWAGLSARYPRLSMVTIVGSPGALAEAPGHDLTYMAENDLLQGTALPPTLFADMAGSLMVSEAVLQALLRRMATGKGSAVEVSLSSAASYLALPRKWGLTQPAGAVGGAHAGYNVYRCQDGRVAVAALEPHFAARLLRAAGIDAMADAAAMHDPAVAAAVAGFMARQGCAQLDAWAAAHDVPLHTLPDGAESAATVLRS